MQQMTINNSQQQQYRTRINQYIKVPQIRLIKEDGSSVIMATRDALKLAQDQSLDLVEINSKASPPVVKIMDFGKFKYDEKKKQQAAKKNQQVQELKELTFRPCTDENDLKHKIEQAKGFLADGNRVKFTVRFKGREITHANLGKEKIEWIVKQLDGLIAQNPQISLEGKFMFAIVIPNKGKAQN
jgi:translation initiation factor IF-3